MTTFKITKLRDGGYVVSSHDLSEMGMAGAGAVFASAKIGEALEYVREKLSAEPASEARR